MLQFSNILGVVPANLKQQALDTVIDFLSGEAKKYVGQELANKIKKLRSDAAFNEAFEEGLQNAVNRFVEEYENEDEDLVTAISTDKEFFKNEQVQNALAKILKQPGAYLASEHEVVVQSFDSVLPTRKNRERVDRAIVYLLKCLAEELWHLPELQPIYSLQFQRITAESAQQQIELQKMQLQALTGLSSSIREPLLALTNAIAEQKALPPNNVYALPERPTIYHNLPQPDYGKFVGRSVELQQLAQKLRPYPHSQAHLITIDGIGGIGKSALALEIAHRYLRNPDDLPPEERFEALIWTSAKRVVLTPEGISMRHQILRTLDDIYTAIAVTLQRENIIRAQDENIHELVRNALTCQRTLLIVDNLETIDDDAVINFLQELPAPTKAIVTTRHRINVAYPIRLVGMPWDEAQILIKQECKKRDVPLLDNDDTHLFYDRTGGVPLAIVWSIAQMRSGYGANAILHRLGQPTNDIARFCFEGVIEQIRNKPSHKMLMLLSLCATDAGREALGYAAALSEFDRDDGLVELERLSLVNKNCGRFSLLPLTKQFALAELDKAPEKDSLQGKWVEYFRTLSKEYCKLHYNWTNYDWLLSEGDNILAIIDWAVTNNHEEIALSLTRAAQRYLNITGNRKMFDYAKQLLNIAQSLHDKSIYAWICVNWLSWFYVEQGNTVEAEALIRQSLSIYIYIPCCFS
ncbi:MAG: AAA family ATPase [Sedimentisphaerales bacterium]|nr:AAA family ATPase [Sedimentisphaerales bacterium]